MLYACLFCQLVVHVGVSGIAKGLTLEQLAHNDGYDKCDVQGIRITIDYCLCNAIEFRLS